MKVKGMFSKKAPRFCLVAAAGAALTLLLAMTAAGAGEIERVSTKSDGSQVLGENYLQYSSVSGDGHYVAYQGRACAAPVSCSGQISIFRKDTINGANMLVSADSSGVSGSATSLMPSISGDGRYVAFYSTATNLVSGDTNGLIDVFWKDTQTGAVQRVSTDSDGLQGTGGTNHYSYSPAISADGRYVAFASPFTNLVAGDTNNNWDIFVKDTQTGTTTRVSTDADGVQANNDSGRAYDVGRNVDISGDGRFVAFQSWASNLVPGDTTNMDIFVKDTVDGSVTQVTHYTTGIWAFMRPSISADGSWVAYQTVPSGSYNPANPPHIYVMNTGTGTTSLVSANAAGVPGDGISYAPDVSVDGRVAFWSLATNLVPDDTNASFDIFVKDVTTAAMYRASLNAAGEQADGMSRFAAISNDGRWVSFESWAENLVGDDTNRTTDVFLKAPHFPDTCEPGVRPALYLSHTSFWATFADYLDHEVSVTFTVSNHGPDTAYAAAITGALNNRGAVLLTGTPIELGDIADGASAVTTVRYYAPAGIPQFDTELTGRALDACGTGFTYPPE